MRCIFVSFVVIALAVAPAMSAPHSLGSSTEARALNEGQENLYARNPSGAATQPKNPGQKRELDSRNPSAGRIAGKVAGNVLDAVGQSAAKDKINSYLSTPPVIPPGLNDAAKAANSPHDPALVQAAIQPKNPGQKRELDSRNPSAGRIAGKVAGNVLDAVGQSAAKDKINSYLSTSPVIPPGLNDAAKAATSPHSPALVQAAITPKPPGKRTLAYNDLSDRDVMETIVREYVKNVYKREILIWRSLNELD